MLKTLTLTAATALAATLLAAAPASAAPLAPQSLPGIATEKLVETVQWRRCRAWRVECSRRWGLGGWRYRRCLANHGCL